MANILPEDFLDWAVLCAVSPGISTLWSERHRRRRDRPLQSAQGHVSVRLAGAVQQLAALRWQIAMVQIPFVVLFVLLVGPRLCGGWSRCCWRWAIQRASLWMEEPPPFRCIDSVELSARFRVEQLAESRSTTSVAYVLFGALFAMHSHVFGEVMDIAPDRLSGRRTTATQIGSVHAKFLIACLLAIESVLVHLFFQDALIAAFLGVGAVWFILDAKLFWKGRAYTSSGNAPLHVGLEHHGVARDLLELDQDTLTHARHMLFDARTGELAELLALPLEPSP